MVSVTSYCDNKDESHNERSPHSSSMAAINKTDYGHWWAVGSMEKVGRQNGEAAVQLVLCCFRSWNPCTAGLLQCDAFQGLTKLSVDSTSRSLRP